MPVKSINEVAVLWVVLLTCIGRRSQIARRLLFCGGEVEGSNLDWWQTLLATSKDIARLAIEFKKQLRRGLVKLTMCSAVGLDERYKREKEKKIDTRWMPW
jgi:hypothetical protein